MSSQGFQIKCLLTIILGDEMIKIPCFFKQLSFLFGLSLMLVVQSVHAEETAGTTDYQTEDFVYKAQNPLSPNYSIPVKYTHHGGAENGDVSIGSIQPIMPIKLGDWNIINQLSLNIIGTHGPVNGIAELPEPFPGSGIAGLGDTTFTSYFTPAEFTPTFPSYSVPPEFHFAAI